MMIEFEDHEEAGRDLLLEYLRQHPPTPCSACQGRGCDLCSHTGLAEFMGRQGPSRKRVEGGCLGRLIGRLCLAYWRWRYRPRN